MDTSKKVVLALRYITFALASLFSAMMYFENVFAGVELTIVAIFVLFMYQLSNTFKRNGKTKKTAKSQNSRAIVKSYSIATYMFQYGYISIGSVFLLTTAMSYFFSFSIISAGANIVSFASLVLLGVLTFLISLWQFAAFFIVIFTGKSIDAFIRGLARAPEEGDGDEGDDDGELEVEDDMEFEVELEDVLSGDI